MNQRIRLLSALTLLAPWLVVAAGHTPDAIAEPVSPEPVAQTPPMGWNSWNQFGCDINEQVIRQTAQAMVADGMRDADYRYVVIDDCWQAPQRSAEGELQADPTRFPSGIKALADYVHSLGLKLGIYGNPGVRSCAQRNRGYPGLSGSLGHVQQDADTYASWGIDYLKYDWCRADEYGVDRATAFQEMGAALQATGRPIVYSINPSDGNALGATGYWDGVANMWRTTGDIKPVWDQGAAGVVNILDKQVGLAKYAGPGQWNDPDMLEVGVVPGGYTAGYPGLTNTEARAHFSLWAMLAAPLIAGADLRNLDPTSTSILTNRDVLAVDQDPAGAEASKISDDGNDEVWARPLADGSVAVALLNRGTTSARISTTAAAAGLPALSGDAAAYSLKNLWTHQTTETAGAVSATVPSHGVVMYRVTPVDNPTQVPPDTTLGLQGLDSLAGGTPTMATVSFTDNGVLPAQQVQLSLDTPAGWSVRATSPTSFGAVESGQTVSATYEVTPAAPDQLFPTAQITAAADYQWHGKYRLHTDVTTTAAMASPPVRAPYRTYSSATDAPTRYAELGDRFGLSGAGSDLYKTADAYTTIYRPGSVGLGSTVETKVVSTTNLSTFGKTGILVRNDMTASDTGTEGLILYTSPSGGIQMEWNSNGGTRINNVAPVNGTIPSAVPVWLRLTRTTTTSYTGFYSTDGTTWHTVATVSVPGQAATQDAGMFVTSHATGSAATVEFDGFSASP